MRIGIDARYLFFEQGKGVKSYCYHLLNNLKNIDTNNKYFLFYNENDVGQDYLKLPSNFHYKQCFQRGGERFYLWEQLRLPFELMRVKTDVFHFPANKVSAFNTHNAVLTLHDTLIFEEDDKNYKGKIRFYMHYFNPIFYKKVKHIITISNYSKERIIERFKVEPEKISVIYNGISDDFKKVDQGSIDETKQKLNITGEYIFALGSSCKRKNIPNLIKAYLELSKNTSLNEKLVISGLDSATKQSYELLFPELANNHNILLLPFLSMQELITLYSGSKLFVFPSIGEGFGLPPLEAMACAVPVIASTYTSIPEVLGDAAYSVDTKDYQQLAQAIKLLLENKILREEYKTKGLVRAKQFSWRKTAEQTLDVYTNAANSLKPSLGLMR